MGSLQLSFSLGQQGYLGKATVVALGHLTNIAGAHQPKSMTEIPALSGPCQTIDGINQGGVIGHYLLGN